MKQFRDKSPADVVDAKSKRTTQFDVKMESAAGQDPSDGGLCAEDFLPQRSRDMSPMAVEP